MKKSVSKLSISILFSTFLLSIQAQNFSLVNDMNTSKDGNPYNEIENIFIARTSNPAQGFITDTKFAVLNGVAYFSANDGIHGTEIWRSNGTTSGTYMLKEINAGSTSTHIQNIVTAGSKIFFTADGIVYMSDGTEAGTTVVPGISEKGTLVSCLTPIGSVVYYVANLYQLWRTDGTTTGTTMILDFYNSYQKNYLGQLTGVNNTLFFTVGSDRTYGVELWKSNGTSAGTSIVKDIYPGTEGSRPSNLTSVNNKLYFSANDGTGIKLWVSDGTANGTQPVINNNNALLQQLKLDGTLDLSPFITVYNIIYFKAYTPSTGFELYKYDVTNPLAGVILVRDLVTGTISSSPANLVSVDSTLYFSASGSNGNQQIWKSTGTSQATILVKNMGTNVPQFLSNFTSANGKLLFSFYNKANGYELWKSDGSSTGTKLVKDICAGNHSSMPSSITYLKTNLCLLSANNGVQGFELWKTNGETLGTSIVKDINNTTTSSFNPDFAYGTTYLKNQFFFRAYTPSYGTNLFISDGTANGTQLLKDINSGNSSNPSCLRIFKDNVYFAADSAGYPAIYKTDGTISGTSKVFAFKQLNTRIRNIVTGQNYLYVFLGDLDSNYIQLWSSNGTSAGFRKIQNISSQSIGGIVVGNILYFSGFDSTHGKELWKASNTIGSAKMVKDINAGVANSSPFSFVICNSKLYFSAVDTDNNAYIFTSDGTQVGTKTVARGNGPFVAAGNNLFFSGYDPNAGNEIFISDGTTTGTKLLKDIELGVNSSIPENLKVVNNTVYFTAFNYYYGTELWKTDGTTNGTVIVKDIYPGSGGSSPLYFTSAGNQLYFIASNIQRERKLFVTDGTGLGTKEVNDLGLEGVTINSFVGGGDRLYINGYTEALGSELYAGTNIAGFSSIKENATTNKIEKHEVLSALIIGNPVIDQLNISINNDINQEIQIVITDASGKVLLKDSKILITGITKLSYPVRTFSTGIYNVKIISADGTATQLKFVK